MTENYNAFRDHDKQGTGYYAQKEYDRAIIEFNLAIKCNSDYAEAYYHRGLVYVAQENYEQAIKDFRNTIQLDPNNADAREQLESLRSVGH